MERLLNYLTTTDHLLGETAAGKEVYCHPALKNLGCVTLVLLREIIAPAVFRNSEQEITDIECNGETFIRAVPNKFKYPERGRALQILRAMGVGGRFPQNRSALHKGNKPSDAFDLNTLVFGDSANHENRVLPVKAAVQYSDALSLKGKYLCVEETFHNRATEDGTLFDPEEKKNSTNLFTRHFLKPGTLLVQVLSTRGRVLPLIGLKHLLLSIGFAGCYGGQTSVTGINVRTHFVGAYADSFEQAITSPYELLRVLHQDMPDDLDQIATVTNVLYQRVAKDHALAIPGQEVAAWVSALVETFQQPESTLQAEYKAAVPKVAELFDQWFGK